MKKTTRKLVLRKETVRELSGQALSRVIGGQEMDTAVAYPYSNPKQCLSADGYPFSNPKQCLSADAYPWSGIKQCTSG
jgi:hypothetical protein